MKTAEELRAENHRLYMERVGKEGELWSETQQWLLGWLQNPDHDCKIEALPLGLYRVSMFDAKSVDITVGWGNKDDRAVRHAASRLPPDERPDHLIDFPGSGKS